MSEHDDFLQRCVDVAAEITPREAAAAFLASFSTRNLDHRGAFGAYAIFRKLEHHAFVQSPIFSGGKRGTCSICGLASPPNEVRLPEDSRGTLYYLPGSLLCLEKFAADDKPEPTPDDIDVFAKVMSALRNRKETKLGELEKLIRGHFKSNKRERQELLEVLAVVGVFDLQAESYFDGWVTYDVRESVMPSHFYAKETRHPLRHYQVDTPLRDEAIEFWFGEWVSEM